MAHLFDTIRNRSQATAAASSFAAVSEVAMNDLSGTGSALAMGCAP